MTVQLPPQLQPLARIAATQRLGLVAVAIVGVVAALWLFVQPSASRAINLATTARPDTFTELYFTHHLGLPQTVTTGQTVHVPYTVVNHENRPMTYNYRISLAQDGTVRILETGSFTLTAGEETSRTLHFTPIRHQQTMVIVIELLDQQQTIYFRTKS